MTTTNNSGFTLAKQIALYQQHLDKIYCDVVIKINDEEFFVHGCIVAAACPKLHEYIEKHKVRVDVKDRPSVEVTMEVDVFTTDNFEFILMYIYVGSLDWNKVKPNLVTEVLAAAHWCEFDQLVEDYMSSNRDNEVEVEVDQDCENSTIVMVDTCNEMNEQPGSMEIVKDLAANYYTTASQNQDVLFCIFCAEQFDTKDGMLLVEHMKSHQSNAANGNTVRRKRKASLGIKQKYKSLLPPSSNKDSDDELNNEQQSASEDEEPIQKKSGLVPMFKKEFTCRHCGKQFASKKALLMHLRRQCEAKDRVKSDEDAGQEESVEEEDNDYVLELSSDPANHPKTTKGFTIRTGGFVRPYTKKNTKGKSQDGSPRKAKVAKVWVCPHCPEFIFERKRDQLEHIKSVHGAIKRYVCDHCGKDLDGRTALTLHMRIHTGERPFVCPICGRGFSERKTMEDHTRRHTGERPFLCTVCGKDFTFRQSLYRHMKFHSGKRPYACEVCGKSFVLKQNLQEHIGRHKKHKLIKCVNCYQQFSNQEMMLKHQKEVHGDGNEQTTVTLIDMTNDEVKNLETVNYEVTIEEDMLEMQ